MTSPPPKKSDLGVRTLSAVVMLAVAGAALWLGGGVWTVFVAAVALGVLWEWWGLTSKFRRRFAWNIGGIAYVLLAAGCLWQIRLGFGIYVAALVIVSVIATDIGAYFAGRAIGGPKIAPSISPSKTWAGLIGGMAAASLVLAGFLALLNSSNFISRSGGFLLHSQASYDVVIFPTENIGVILIAGPLIAIIAQTGDFFESWMKRRAGVKDSGSLIPGHGGLFDRVDGLLAVLFVIGLIGLVTIVTAISSGEGLLPTPA